MILRKGKMFYITIDNAIFCAYMIPTLLLVYTEIRNEWGYVYFDSFTSQSRCTAIFINNNFGHKVHNTVNDNSGNSLALNIEFGNIRSSLAVIHVYGPNEDNPGFYNIVSESISNFKNDNII